MKSIIKNNLILTLGLGISLVSIVFNVFVFGYHFDIISQKEERLDYINFTNLYLSNEFNHAENIYFKSKFIEHQINEQVLLDTHKENPIILDLMEKDLASLRIKSVNYAYNSTLNNDNSKYDSIVVKKIFSFINEFNRNKKLSKDELDNLNVMYQEYYRTHENNMRLNMNEKNELRTEIREHKKRNSWMNFLGVSFQTIGLILVFLKDIKKN